MRVAALLLLLALPAQAAPRTLALPDETASFAPGPGVEVVQGNCATCHSADYVTTQPRRLPDPAGFWRAEVLKMRTAYGASIEDEDVPAIVRYLAETYGH